MIGNIYHALGLHMHQPPGNLRVLIDSNDWEAQQIMKCYERVPRYAMQYHDVARIHVGFSGILLEQFLDRDIVDRYRAFVDVPEMLHSYREARNVELIGMGYFHPVFPLIPREDWAEHLARGRDIVAEVFGRAPRGFWPSEMAFDMEMVPALVEAGYEYVVVDGVHVRPDADDSGPGLFRPFLARHDDAAIVVVPRDRDVSNAQESGMDAGWFIGEVERKVSQVAAPGSDRLVTTWSDGENGGWFRQMDEHAGFFGHFLAPFLERVRSGATAIRPTLLSDFLDGRSVADTAHVQTGAWNVADTSGYDFSQWSGSPARRAAIEKIFDVSRRYHALSGRPLEPAARARLDEARQLILEGETSCFLFWGDDWVPKLYERTGPAEALLEAVESEAR